MIVKRKICWVTASYFLQVDLPVLSTLHNYYDIEWYVWGSKFTDDGKLAEKYAKENNISISFIDCPYSIYNPLSYLYNRKVILNLASKEYDAYYFDISTFPWLLFCIKNM